MERAQSWPRRPVVHPEPRNEIPEGFHEFAVEPRDQRQHAVQREAFIQKRRYMPRRQEFGNLTVGRNQPSLRCTHEEPGP